MQNYYGCKVLVVHNIVLSASFRGAGKSVSPTYGRACNVSYLTKRLQ
jgi:hypothetical protein